MAPISKQQDMEILELLDAGHSDRYVAKRCHVGRASVRERRLNLRPSLTVSKGGRPFRLLGGTRNCVVLTHKLDPGTTLQETTNTLRDHFGIKACREVVRQTLKHARLRFKRKRRRPRLTDSDRQLRRQFVKEFKDWTPERWDHVLFCDEKLFNRYPRSLHRGC